jgi:hypothetical protein
MIWPAKPFIKMSLVDATLRDKRKRVTKSSSEGKVDNSRASFEARVIIKTAMAREILHARSVSSINVGRGTINVARTITSPTARIILLRDELFALSILPSGLEALCVDWFVDDWLSAIIGSSYKSFRLLISLLFVFLL